MRSEERQGQRQRKGLRLHVGPLGLADDAAQQQGTREPRIFRNALGVGASFFCY